MFRRIKLVNNKDKQLIDDIKRSNSEDNSIWKIPNLIFPLAAIILAIISNMLFSNFKADFYSYINILLNGSLPLIAINQISASGVYVFNFDRKNEQKYKINTSYLRTKLYWSVIAVLILSVLIFSYQVIMIPFENITGAIFLFIFSGVLIYLSSWVTRRIFLLQDDLIEKTFNSEIREEARNTHGKTW